MIDRNCVLASSICGSSREIYMKEFTIKDSSDNKCAHYEDFTKIDKR
jgi:hypothetical protein